MSDPTTQAELDAILDALSAPLEARAERRGYRRGVLDGKAFALEVLKAFAPVFGKAWDGGRVDKAAKHAPKGGATVAGKRFAGGEFIPGEVLAQASPEELARLEGKSKAAPEDEPDADEWDGTIDQNAVEFGSGWDEEDYAEFYDADGRCTVSLDEGEFTPPGADDPVPVYRWVAHDADNSKLDAGEWTTDRAEARDAGEEYARDKDQTRDPEDDDIPADIDGQAWVDRELIDDAGYTKNGADWSVRLDEAEFEFMGQTHTAYRWTTRRHADGEWTLDRRQAIRDGRGYAEDQHEDDEDDEDDDGPQWDSTGGVPFDLSQLPPPAKKHVVVGPQKQAESAAAFEYGQVDEANGDALLSHIFGEPDADTNRRALVACLGMPDDATAKVVAVGDFDALFGDDKPKAGAQGVRVSVSHPKMGRVSRFVGVDHEGRRFIRNEIVEIKPQFQGEGLGADIFARQVEAAASRGIEYIETHAAKSSTMNGYATWPKFGYDQAFDDPASVGKVWENAKQLFPEANSVLDLLETREGEEWWCGKKNPDGTRTEGNGTDLYNARFDLDPDSRSMARLRAYAGKKAQTKAGATTKSFSPRNKKTHLTPRPSRSGDRAPVRKAWDESQHPRDHGEFSKKPGGSSGNGSDQAPHPDAPAHAAHATAGLGAKLPAGVWDKVGDKVATAAAKVYAAMVRATPAALKAMSVIEALIDTPEDMQKLGYAPGTGAQTTGGQHDAVRAATGGLISGHVAATIAAHVLSRAVTYAKSRLAGRKGFDDAGGYAEAAGIVAECLRHVSDALGLDHEPDEAAIAAALRGTQAKAFAEGDHPRGDDGRFVSKEQMAAAKSDPAKAAELRAKVTDPEQRAKLDAHIGGDSDAAPAAATNRHLLSSAVDHLASNVVSSFKDLRDSLPPLPDDQFAAGVAKLADAGKVQLHRDANPESYQFRDTGGLYVDGEPLTSLSSDGTISADDLAAAFGFGAAPNVATDPPRQAPASVPEQSGPPQEGKPFKQTLYHGTQRKIEGDHLEPAKPGLHATDAGNMGLGVYFTPHERVGRYHAGGRDEGLHAVPVSLKKPLLIEGDKNKGAQELAKRLGVTATPEYDGTKQVNREWSRELAERAKAAGYDGVVWTKNGNVEEVAAFSKVPLNGESGRPAPDNPHVAALSEGARATHDAIRQHLAGTAPDKHKRILAALQGHTVADLHAIKRALGLKASGRKAEVVNKIALRAQGLDEPRQGYSGRLRDTHGNVQLWQKGRLIGTVPADNPSAHDPGARLSVDDAHAHITEQRASGSIHTPEGQQALRNTLESRMTVKDYHALAERMGLKLKGGRKGDKAAQLAAHGAKETPGEKMDRLLTATDQAALAGVFDRHEIDTPADTDAHAQEREEAAEEKRDRMQQWAQDKPGSVAAEEAANRAQGRLDRTRAQGPAPKPGSGLAAAAGGIDPAAVLADAVKARTAKTYQSGGKATNYGPGDVGPADVQEAAKRHRAGRAAPPLPPRASDPPPPPPPESGLSVADVAAIHERTHVREGGAKHSEINAAARAILAMTPKQIRELVRLRPGLTAGRTKPDAAHLARTLIQDRGMADYIDREGGYDTAAEKKQKRAEYDRRFNDEPLAPPPPAARPPAPKPAAARPPAAPKPAAAPVPTPAARPAVEAFAAAYRAAAKAPPEETERHLAALEQLSAADLLAAAHAVGLAGLVRGKPKAASLAALQKATRDVRGMYERTGY